MSDQSDNITALYALIQSLDENSEIRKAANDALLRIIAHMGV